MADQSTSSSFRFWLLMVVLAGLFLVYVVTSRQGGMERADGTKHPAVGRELQQLQLEPLIGASETVTLPDVRGEVVLINYWGTWCPPCRMEFPELMDAYGELKDQKDFRLLSVSCPGGNESVAQLRVETRQFLDDEKYEIPVYSDLEESSRQALVRSANLDSFNFPTTVLLDRAGIIRGLWVGYVPGVGEAIREAAAELLSDAPTSTPLRAGT